MTDTEKRECRAPRRLLFVDIVSEFGHDSLNRVYIERFRELGFEVEVAAKAGYLQTLCLDYDLPRLDIPLRYYSDGNGPLSERIQQLRILRYLRRSIEKANYEIIFFSCFEEISFCCSGIRGNLVLLAHANVAGCDNVIKRLFFRRLAGYGRIIVFHEFIKKRCEELGVTNIQVEAQGLDKPYLLNVEKSERALAAIDSRLSSREFQRVLFAPAGSKYSDGVIKELVNDQATHEFLDRTRTLFVIHDKPVGKKLDHVVWISRHLSNLEYQALFMRSTAIVLSYPDTFKYRVSAALFECFANDKLCLLSDIEGFRAFERHFRYSPIFSEKNEFIGAVERVYSLAAEVIASPYKDKELLRPVFREQADKWDRKRDCMR